MAYCTNSQVAEEFKSLSTATGAAITTTIIDRFIAESDAEIDGKLGLKYVTPVTDATALVLLRPISIMLAAHRVAGKMELKTSDANVKQEGQKSRREEALAILQDIIDGKVKLGSATLISASDGVSSYTSSNDVAFTFDRDEDQW